MLDFPIIRDSLQEMDRKACKYVQLSIPRLDGV